MIVDLYELMKYAGNITVSEKGPRDLVTQADLASQERIQKLIKDRFPDHLFLGEEATNHAELWEQISAPDSPQR